MKQHYGIINMVIRQIERDPIINLIGLRIVALAAAGTHNAMRLSIKETSDIFSFMFTAMPRVTLFLKENVRK